MRRSHQNALDRWLAAERDDRGEEAEAALFELLAALPSIAPPAGFADRVLARAGVQAARRDPFASRWVRLTVALSLLATGVGVLSLPSTLEVLRVLAGIWSLGELVQGGVQALAAASQWLAAALQLWDLLLTVGRALIQPLRLPQTTAMLTLCLLVASLAFRFLRDQITGERTWTHVDPV
jgi:hypothetical protein